MFGSWLRNALRMQRLMLAGRRTALRTFLGWVPTLAAVAGCSLLAPSKAEIVGGRAQAGADAGLGGMKASNGGAAGDPTMGGLAGRAGDSSGEELGGENSGLEPPPTGRELWLRANSVIAVESGPVSTWADLDSVRAARQELVNEAPTLQADGLNGLPLVHFDGVNDVMLVDSGFTDFNAGVTLFAVIWPDSVAGQQGVASFDSPAGSQYVGLGIDAGKAVYYSQNANVASSVASIQAGTATQISIVHDNDSVRIFADGALIGEQAQVDPVDFQLRKVNRLGAGPNGVATDNYSGAIAELVVYSVALSDLDRSGVEQYLRWKWRCCQ